MTAFLPQHSLVPALCKGCTGQCEDVSELTQVSPKEVFLYMALLCVVPSEPRDSERQVLVVESVDILST